jgi:hypothetical protein
MKTKLEILKETYEYYSDPSKRGISKDGISDEGETAYKLLVKKYRGKKVC